MVSAVANAELWKACAAGYSGWFGVVRSGAQVGSGSVFGFPSVSANWIARYRTPEPVVILGFEARDHGIGPGNVRHCQHARCLHKVEPVVGGDAEQAVVPHPKVVIGPEERLCSLRGRASRAVESAQLLDLVKVFGVLPACQLIGPVGPKL